MEILELNESDKLPIQRHTLTNIEGVCVYAKRMQSHTAEPCVNV